MNTKDIKTDNMKLKVLVYGGSGTGKTFFCGTFPKPYFFDFDGGMLTLQGRNVEYDTYKDENPTGRPTAFANFEAKLTEMYSRGWENFPYETVVLDSMTTMQEAAMRYIKHTNRTMSKMPTLQEWGMLIDKLQEVLYKVTSLRTHVVVTAHEQVIQDDLTSEIMVLPLITGKKLPDRLPLWFDEVYHSRVERGKERQPVYQMMTVAERKYKAKSRLRCFEQLETSLSFDRMMAKLRASQNATNKGGK